MNPSIESILPFFPSVVFSCPQTALEVTLSLTNSLTNYNTLLKNTTIQHSERLVALETCDESNEETWPDQQKDKDKDKDDDKDKDNDKDI